eukprot:3063624-Lingulodinium_polyedra.AAC.1
MATATSAFWRFCACPSSSTASSSASASKLLSSVAPSACWSATKRSTSSMNTPTLPLCRWPKIGH